MARDERQDGDHADAGELGVSEQRFPIQRRYGTMNNSHLVETQSRLSMTTRNREDILMLLRQHHGAVTQRFDALELALFGSAARDELRDDSDVDVLVRFAGPATYDAYFGLKDYLEHLLGRPVDLVTQKGLKPRARQQVERDLIRVA